MILVDTSVWIDHLRSNEPRLVELLNVRRVLTHPFVTGELACGNIKNRETVLRLMRDLPFSPIVSDEEALFFIEQHSLMGRGVGYVDVHLLAATSLAGVARLWTRDKRLAAVVQTMNLALESE